jgi:rod shape-determining protein MreD
VSYLIVLLLGILAAVLQSTLLRALLPPDFVPDVILLIVLYGSLLFPLGKGLLASFTLGLLADLFSGAPEGLNALFAIVVFSLSKAVQARVFMRGSRAIWTLLLLAFGLKIPYYALLYIVFGFHFPYARDAVLVWLGEFVSSLLLMPALFYMISRSLGLRGGWFLQSQRSSPA